jgi:type I restriction enzyme R subunit/putative DNA methylase
MIEERPSGHADTGNAGVPAGNSGRADGDVGVPREWYSRGYLPHRDRAGLLQSITFRLADSLPQEKLRELDAELACLSAERRDAERRRRIEEWLDSGMGCCALGHPLVAGTVQDSLLHFNGERYQLLAWCIMPNHVHVLVEPRHPVARIVQGWKSVTSRQVLARNEELQLGIPDPRHLWMREYWDRYIRDDNHLRRVTGYIYNNPVKAGLCRNRKSGGGQVLGTPASSPATR